MTRISLTFLLVFALGVSPLAGAIGYTWGYIEGYQDGDWSCRESSGYGCGD